MARMLRARILRDVQKLHRGLQEALYFSGESKNIDFYISSLTDYNPFYSTFDIEEWLKTLNTSQYFDVKQVPLTELQEWQFHKETGDLEHVSGGFFSIRGLRVKTNIGEVTEWSQPIIYQPEVGILGLLTKKIHGILYFLVQAKAEPGNINTYQISPTVQATRSNYMRLHGGKSTPYLEYFLHRKHAHVLIDQLQSEQGARFYRKRNRNIIVRIADDEDIEVGPRFRWLTLGQIHHLAQKDNTVNMDTRSIISEINFAPERVNALATVGPKKLRDVLESSLITNKPMNEFGIQLAISSHPNVTSLHSIERLLQRVTHEKCNCIIETQLIPLNNVERWRRTDHEIFHEAQRYFSVMGVRIDASDREVRTWDQPIIKQKHSGIVGFVVKEIDGVLHFLIQLKMESGVMDLLEMAPTVQCITDNYTAGDMPPFTDTFLHRGRATTIFDVYQSEEGGRFFRESNQNIMLLVPKSFPIEEPDFYMWLSFKQFKEFIKFSNFVNVEARSILASIKMT